MPDNPFEPYALRDFRKQLVAVSGLLPAPFEALQGNSDWARLKQVQLFASAHTNFYLSRMLIVALLLILP